MSRKMAEALRDDVILSSPVSRITTGGAKVIVESARVRVTARRVIVAMMPADTRRIAFSPELPKARQGLVKAWAGEPAIKVNAVYPKPFWRDAGLSGLGISDRGPVAVTFDNSPPDGSQGVLLAFLSEEHAVKNSVDRRKAVLEGFVHLFGKSAANPTDCVETDWSADPWTTGCVSPIGPRTLTRFGAALRAPAGLIHWAGTETSEIWCGYMDGAVRSGRRAAAEVLKAL
jgi:monoamine oxidase